MAGAMKRAAATNAGGLEKFGITLLRVVVGAVFVMHGWQKWFDIGPKNMVAYFSSNLHIPPYATYMAMTAELGCGFLLAVGLLTRLAAIPILITMIVAIMKVHLKNGFFLDIQHGVAGFEFALTLGVAALALIFTGPGTLAVDNLLD